MSVVDRHGGPRRPRRRPVIVREAGLLMLVLALLPALLLETTWRELPDAPQTMYRDRVPHTDRIGSSRTAFEASASFFPIGIYHALDGRFLGRDYAFETFAAGGFNTVHVWERQPPDAAAAAAKRAGLQLIYHDAEITAVQRLHDHPAILSWYLDEEPALRFPESEQSGLIAAFDRRRASMRQYDPDRPYHIVAAAPRRLGEWDTWMRHSDVAAFSVYPLRAGQPMRLAGDRALVDSVSRAVAVSDSRKPVWLVVQAFASPRYRWRMPTSDEYRTMVFAAIVHGATGIVAFAFDSFVTRDGQVQGIAPEPVGDFGAVPDYDGAGDPPLVSNSREIAASRALWNGVVRVNRELAALAPALLSPTADLPYQVSVRGLSEVATPVRTLLKRDAQGYVLIAVNLGSTPLETKLAFDAAIVDVRKSFVGDAEPETVSGRGWQTRLAAFETKIFRFDVSQDAAFPAGAAR